MESIVLEFPGYDYRRVTAELHRRGWMVNHKRVLRIMREESLLCQIRRRFVPTTNFTNAFGIYPNLIKDAELDGLNQAWIFDITPTSPISACPRRSATWRPYWTPIRAGALASDSRSG